MRLFFPSLGFLSSKLLNNCTFYSAAFFFCFVYTRPLFHPALHYPLRDFGLTATNKAKTFLTSLCISARWHYAARNYLVGIYVSHLMSQLLFNERAPMWMPNELCELRERSM